MTHTMILVQRKALAIQEAFEVLEEISSEAGGAERLIEAKSEPVREPEYALSILVAELAQVVADQQKRIERLEAKGSRSRSGGSSAGKKTGS